MNPRTDIDSFVCASEDFEEGTSIFDEYLPDQLGAVQRPVQTVASDGLFALATGVMLIRSEIASVVAVEAHSKASNVVSHGRVARFAMDPVLNRPLGVPALAVAGLEMQRYLHVCGPHRRRLRRASPTATGLTRPRTVAHPTPRRRRTPAIRCSSPLTVGQTADSVDGCVVIVLAAEDRAPATSAVFVDGVGWNQDAPSLESRDWDRAAATARAAEQAYARAGVTAADVDAGRGRRHLRLQAAAAPRRPRPRGPRSRPRQPLGRRARRGAPARGERPRARPRLHRATAGGRGHHRRGAVLARSAQQLAAVAVLTRGAA